MFDAADRNERGAMNDHKNVRSLSFMHVQSNKNIVIAITLIRHIASLVLSQISEVNANAATTRDVWSSLS